MKDDKMTASWSARRSKRAIKPFGDGMGKLGGGNAVPGVHVRMYGDDDATTRSDFAIRIEDAVKLGRFLVILGYKTSFTTTVCMSDTSSGHIGCDVALHASSEGDPAIVVIESKRDGRFLFSVDCARQLGRTLLTLAFPDDWHSSGP